MNIYIYSLIQHCCNKHYHCEAYNYISSDDVGQMFLSAGAYTTALYSWLRQQHHSFDHLKIQIGGNRVVSQWLIWPKTPEVLQGVKQSSCIKLVVKVMSLVWLHDYMIWICDCCINFKSTLICQNCLLNAAAVSSFMCYYSIHCLPFT